MSGGIRGSSVVNRYILLPLIASLLLSVLVINAFADDNSFLYSGYFRNFLLITDTDDDTDAEIFARWRLKLDYRQSEKVTWEAAYEVAPIIRINKGDSRQTALRSVAGPDPLSYRIDDIDEQLYPDDDETGSDLILLQNLDRLNVTLSAESFDLFIGRQGIAFGSARVINPTDIIAPFTYNTLVKEERIGVDAMRVKVPTGWMGEIDLGAVFGDDLRYDKSAGFIRLKSYLAMTDVVLMGMVFSENYLLGLDLARSLGGAGTWVEAAYTFANEGSDEDYFRLSAGADYSFTENLYGYLEYHYNSAGSSDPEDYLSRLSKTAYTEGAVYLLAEHYVAAGLSYQLSPLTILYLQPLVNLNDGSVLAAPIVEYSLADDATMSLGAYIGIGEEPSDPFTPESEFGLYADTYYISLNIYF